MDLPTVHMRGVFFVAPSLNLHEHIIMCIVMTVLIYVSQILLYLSPDIQ